MVGQLYDRGFFGTGPAVHGVPGLVGLGLGGGRPGRRGIGAGFRVAVGVVRILLGLVLLHEPVHGQVDVGARGEPLVVLGGRLLGRGVVAVVVAVGPLVRDL